jgi:four helix bundle protein
MQDFRNLDVWQKAHLLALDVYRITRPFPTEERFGLTSQLRRASSAIPANLAEGCGRGSDADFGRFVQVALGSASELDYHLLLCHDLGYLSKETYQTLYEQTARTMRMLNGLLNTLRASSR